MNIHPIIVHFPIALLTVYCILEFIRIKKVTQLSYWFYLKACFAVFGASASVVAYLTGSVIEHQFEEKSSLVELHSFWAKITILTFGIIALAYFVAYLEKSNLFGVRLSGFFLKVWNLGLFFKKIVIESFVVFPLVIFGLFSITITGALGGIIVYGPDLDPFTRFVYNLFVNK